MKEKREEIEQVGKEELELANSKLGPVARFLKQECTSSSFESDYIIKVDFERAYDNFCENFLKSTSIKEALVGSKALQEQGIKLKDSIRIPYLHGIISHSDSKTGLLRRPVYYKNDKIPIKLKAKMNFEEFKDNYFGLNGLLS